MIKFSKEKVLLLHQLMAEATGGDIGVRDEALLESAIENIFATCRYFAVDSSSQNQLNENSGILWDITVQGNLFESVISAKVCGWRQTDWTARISTPSTLHLTKNNLHNMTSGGGFPAAFFVIRY